MNDPAAALVESLAAHLLERRERVAAAESCTGGLVAKLMTDRAGSSDWFDRGAVTYSNAAKHEMLGVPLAVFDTAGAVSETCVLAMASGMLEHSRADWAVAITGIAGPGGATPGKPVGTVWMAWARRGFPPQAVMQVFEGDREVVRQQTAITVLGGLIDRLASADAAARP